MMAIIPKPSDNKIDLYATDRKKYTIVFSRNFDDIAISLFWSYPTNDKEELIPIAIEHVSLIVARNFWDSFVEDDVPYPEILRVHVIRDEKGFSKRAVLASMLLTLGLGFSLGWLAVDRTWFQDLFGSGAVTTAGERPGVAAAGGAISSAPLPEVQRPAAIQTSSSAAPVPTVPSSASPGLRDLASDNQVTSDLQPASPSSGPSLEPNADALIALRELREVIQRGGRVDEALFRRLPLDIQDILRAEGLAPEGSPSQSSDEGVRRSEARLPTGAVLRGGVDAQGVPILPRRLPPGEPVTLPVPMPGGGDLRGAEDFRAFGLQAPR
jgi:hypothetical protein